MLVGASLSLSGRFRRQGEQARDGLQLWVEYARDAGQRPAPRLIILDGAERMPRYSSAEMRNFAYKAALARQSWSLPRWCDRLLVWIKPPGWEPPARGQRWHPPSLDVAGVRRFDPPVSRAAPSASASSRTETARLSAVSQGSSGLCFG